VLFRGYVENIHVLHRVSQPFHLTHTTHSSALEWQPAHLSDTGREVINIVPVARDRGWFERHVDELKSFYDELMIERAKPPPPPPTCLVRDDLYDDLVIETRKRPRFRSDSDDELVHGPSMFVDD
jgi:hypothetical protein